MIQALLSVIISAVISVGAVLGIEQNRPPVSPAVQHAMQEYVDKAMSAKEPIFGTTNPIAGQTYNLSGAGVSQTGTSITLASFTIPQNGYKIPDSALSDTFYITLEPGNPTKQEIVSCTTDTQNANGSATFTGCVRGLSPIPDYTSSSTLKFSHGGGTQVIFSNPPQFYNEFAQLQNTESITGTWTFATSPLLTTDCTGASANSAICAKAYIDSVAVAGASNANETTKGIGEIATGREAASSTSLGGTGARLFLPASLATSSPYSLATSTIVMTQIDGRISPSFMSTSSTYTLGALIANASSTIVGTTTLTANIATGRGLCANSLCYTFPSTHVASGSVMQNDGNGGLSWNLTNQIIYQNTNINLLAGPTATTTYVTVPIPANTLSTTTKSVRIKALYTSLNGTGNTGCFGDIEFGNGSATSTIAYGETSNSASIAFPVIMDVIIYPQTASAQTVAALVQAQPAAVLTPTLRAVSTAINSAAKSYIGLALVAKTGGITCTLQGATVEAIVQ